jgi:hypothetical protein
MPLGLEVADTLIASLTPLAPLGALLLVASEGRFCGTDRWLGNWFLQCFSRTGSDRLRSGHGRSSRHLGGLKNHLMSLKNGLEHIAEVLNQMETVGHLHGLGGAAGGAFGILSASVAAEDLNTRMVCEPLGQGSGRALGEQVHDLVAVQANQDGAVDMAFAKGEIVNAEQARSWAGLWRLTAGQTQKGIWADRHPLTACEASARLSANIKAEPSLFGAQTERAPGTRCNKAGDGFAEGEARAARTRAKEAARVELKGEGSVEQG